jgi:hypothetical protein
MDWQALIETRIMNSKEKVNNDDEPGHTRMTLYARLLPNHILLGRGPTRYLHPGNVTFRDLVKSFATYYSVEACKADKMLVIREIFSILLNAGYRFLYQSNAKGGDWIECTTEMAMRKIQHTLRDTRAHLIRKIKTTNFDHHANLAPRQRKQSAGFLCFTYQHVQKLSNPDFDRFTKFNAVYSDQGEFFGLLDKSQVQTEFLDNPAKEEESIHTSGRSDFESSEELGFLDKLFLCDDILQPCPLDSPFDDQSHTIPSSVKRNLSCNSLLVFLDQCLEDELGSKT